MSSSCRAKMREMKTYVFCNTYEGDKGLVRESFSIIQEHSSFQLRVLTCAYAKFRNNSSINYLNGNSENVYMRHIDYPYVDVSSCVLFCVCMQIFCINILI